jgi:two-component system cell cycle sensor histidine kinase/response regulator CckA
MVFETYHILVVDDVSVVRRMVHRVLTEEGYRVYEAADADEALTVLAMPRAHIDLVLIDVVLPGADGVKLYERIMADWPRMRVVFMSAHPAEILAAHKLRDLRVPFLAKPFTRDELVAKIAQVAERRRSRRSPARGSGEAPAQ